MDKHATIYRAATPGDAHALAELINFAGEGLPVYFWQQMAEPGETVWDVGRRWARRGEGGFSYLNADVAERDGAVIASLIGYPLDDDPEAADYDPLPPLFVPLQELENLAPGAWYVNILAAYPDHRGKGLGRVLLDRADATARAAGCSGMSLIVSDANTGARRLYVRCGYQQTASRKMVKEGWENPGRNWTLLVKRF